MINKKRGKKEGYRWGGNSAGTYYCPLCKKSHHKLSDLGKSHRMYERKK